MYRGIIARFQNFSVSREGGGRRMVYSTKHPVAEKKEGIFTENLLRRIERFMFSVFYFFIFISDI